jgi:hypothetical protein
VDGAELEVPLTGGHNPGVVRVGATVRRKLKPGSDRIHRLLTYFESRGFDGVPRFLGIDARGREILSFIDGFAPPHNGFWLNEEGVRAGARSPSGTSTRSSRRLTRESWNGRGPS